MSRSELHIWKPESGWIINYIVQKSAGMFRLAYCLLEQVKDCARSDDLQTTLDTLPDNLHDIYARSLKSIPEKYHSDVQKLLAWLVFSQRPLTVAELEDTIAFDFLDPERYTFDHRRRPKRGFFIKRLSLLLSVTNYLEESVFDTDGVYLAHATVSLVHSSVQDYLQRHPTWCNSCPIHVCEDVAHRLIAQTCICYLLHVADHPLDSRFSHYPLGRYAADNWCYHLLRSSDQAALSTLTKDLLVAGSRQYAALCHFQYKFWSEPPVPLCMCAELGYIEGVKFLLEEGVDIDVCGTALQWALEAGHIEVARLLLENGANVNAQGDRTALQRASAGGYIEIIGVLLENGADINAQGDRTALQCVSAGGYIEIVRVLLENGADINAQGYETALQCALAGGHIEIVRVLLENGADINAQGDRTALQSRVGEWSYRNRPRPPGERCRY
ncbi:ankyrin repeat-containing domain protein [Mycena olivaceomarginata]|nr:ankyrin repeat-containing domain protein [Mycena olivaceomarginata]